MAHGTARCDSYSSDTVRKAKSGSWKPTELGRVGENSLRLAAVSSCSTASHKTHGSSLLWNLKDRNTVVQVSLREQKKVCDEEPLG